MLVSKWNRWLLCGLAASSLAVGCGDDAEEPGPTQNYDSGVTDAGGFAQDGGLDSGFGFGDGGFTIPEAGTCVNIGQISGAYGCTPPGGGLGYQLCTNGVPAGDCMSLLGAGDAGFTLPEGGFPFGDGGFSLGDSGLPFGDGGLPDGALNNLPTCPSPTVCSTGGILAPFIQAFTMGAGFCAQGDFPAGCTTPNMAGACTSAGLPNAICAGTPLGNFCIQPCSPK